MAWSDIFIRGGQQTADEQQQHYAEQQAEYQAKLAARQAEGTLEQDYVMADMGPLESQNQAAWEGAKEGAAEGLDNILDTPGKVVGTVGSWSGQLLWGVLKNIPWWAWIVAAGLAFWWLGGAVLLRGRLSKLKL